MGNEDEDDEYNEITEAPPVLAPSLPLVPMKNLMPDPPNLSGKLRIRNIRPPPPPIIPPFQTLLPVSRTGVEPMVVSARVFISSFLKGLLHETQ